MCIFAKPVKAVTGTSIFVGRTPTRQCVVYAMSVELRGAANAMILPVYADADDIQLLDISGAPAFFEPLAELFTPPQPRSLSYKGVTRSTLRVQKVGSYDVSVVPTVNDISRLDAGVFTVAPSTARSLAIHYPSCAFVVAVLRDSGAYHPLAYTHPRLRGVDFVPTRHMHGDSGEPSWDHAIYYQAGTPDVRTGMECRSAEAASRTVASMSTMLLGSSDGQKLVPYLRHGAAVSRLRITGRQMNGDIRIV